MLFGVSRFRGGVCDGVKNVEAMEIGSARLGKVRKRSKNC